MINFPIEIPISDIKNTNSLYDKDEMYLYQSLYDGGKNFHSIKDRILHERLVEQMTENPTSRKYQGTVRTTTGP